ncbi:MAG: hypothetical protein ACI31M_02845 [Bacilli bacterium]
MNNKKILQRELELLEKLKHIIIEDKQEFVDNMITNIKKELNKYEK